MKAIKAIKRIKVDLLKLKPVSDQKKVYESYKEYLGQFFYEFSPVMEYFEETTCTICGSGSGKLQLSMDHFNYLCCDNCQIVYNTPRLKKEYLEQMYRTGEYENYVKTLTLPGDKIRKNITEVRKVYQVDALFEKPGSVLDVGCGAGVFLSIAAERGWNCTGIELSESGLQNARDKGVRIFAQSFDDFQSNEKFDCISFWGVLEHVVNPMEQLTKATELLSENGVIVMEVPSADSLLMQYVSNFTMTPYRFIENARHLTFFSQLSIDYLCDKLELDIEHIETNGLDIQTILLYEMDEEIIAKLMNIQQLMDKNLLSDHYRVFFRKNYPRY